MARQWTGIRRDSSSIGDGFHLLQNVSFSIDGECCQRPGLGAKQALTGIIAGELPPLTVMVQADWTVKTVNQSTDAIAVMTGTLGTAGSVRPTMAAAFDRMYFAGGTSDSMKVYDPVSSTLRSIGITAPSGAASPVPAVGGVCSPGTHLVRYRYYDSTRNRLSNPTDAGTVILSEARTAQLAANIGAGGSITGIVVNDQGDGYTSTPALTFSAATAGVQAVASATITGSSVTSIAVTTTGSGYTTAPTVAIAASPTGDNAIGIAGIAPASPYGVAAVYLLDGGSGYTASPAITLSAPAARVLATASAVVVNKKVTGARITNPGAGYTTAPTIAVDAPTGYAVVSLPVTASGDSTVNKIRVEMTAGDSSEFYLVGDYNNTSTTLSISISDGQLIQQETAASYGEWNHLPPQQAFLIAEHSNRLWTWKQGTGRSELLGWSQSGYPESFDVGVNARFVTLDAGDSPSAMFSFFSDLYLCGQRSLRRLAYTDDPGGGTLTSIPGQFGAFNQRCVISIQGGKVFGWGKEGIWALAAMVPKKISGPIDDVIAEYGDATQLDPRFISYDSVDESVLFFFCLSGETTCRMAVVYHLTNGEWTVNRYRQGIYAGCANSNYTDVTRLLLADANGYSWRAGTSTNDGGEAGQTAVAAGSTDTIINCTNTAQIGQMAYFPATAEERLISACDGSSITLSVALAATPATGAVVSIGSFQVKALTNWYPGDGMQMKKKPAYMVLECRPDGTGIGTGTVQYRNDFSTGLVTVTTTASDTYPTGISIGSANAITVDFDTGGQDGFIPVPMASDWKRVVQAEFTRDYAGTDPLRLLDMRFAVDPKVNQAQVVGE